MSVLSNVFYKKRIYKNFEPMLDGNIRNLTSRPAIPRKPPFYTTVSIIFTKYTRNGS